MPSLRIVTVSPPPLNPAAAAVFYEKILLGALEGGEGLSPWLHGFVVFFGFAIWLGVTVGVLLVMESLSATLHALRLTW